MEKAILIAFAAVFLAGCGEGPRTYDDGASDGYAVGYNTACNIRTTLIYGDWDSPEYSRGYADGKASGIAACNHDKKIGKINE